MSVDLSAALDLALVVADHQNPLQTLQDGKTLYNVFQSVQAKTFNASAMGKAGMLEPAAAALARSAALLDTLLKDPKHSASVIALIDSF